MASFLVPCGNDPALNTGNNRLSTGDGYSYDDSGNTIGDAEGRTFVYDAENKQTSVSDANGVIGQYWYDGDGHRVKKYVASTGDTTVFVYDASGKLAAEYSTVVAAVEDAKAQYLTNDNLGTPRINTDATGAITARHDYMPYGEEIVGLGGRSDSNKYSVDHVRQGFTGYLDDEETRLDFANARMYQKEIARFTGADPLLSSGHVEGPQSWNKYAYSENNPLSMVDRTGLYVCKAGKTRCEQFDAAFAKATSDLDKIAAKYKGGKDSKEYKKAERALSVYGAKGVNNGVFILSNDGEGSGRTSTNGTTVAKTKDNPTGQRINVEFDPDVFSKEGFETAVAHEGSHAADGADWVKSGFKDAMNPTEYQTEFDAYTVSSLIAEASGYPAYTMQITLNATDSKSPYAGFLLSSDIWNSSWAAADVEVKRQAGIKKFLRYDNLYNLTPNMKDPRKAWDRKSRF